MYGRTGLDRFKKAQSSEPFSVTHNAKSKPQPAFSESVQHAAISINAPQVLIPQNQYLNQRSAPQKAVNADVLPNAVSTQSITVVGGGQSSWQPPDWAIEPRAGVYYLDVMKDGEVLDTVHLDKRRHIFGRQFQACDFVLDHQSVSRQHAAVIPHKNGSVYVIDLGSAHGTFVANERLSKDSPVELEVGQSLKFAASTRTYILRKNNEALFPPTLQLAEIDLPPPPDPTDDEAVLAYNTYINRSLNGLRKPDSIPNSTSTNSATKDHNEPIDRAPKRMRRIRVAFKDQVGEDLVEIVGFSDGADVETEPGPVGVKEGSLVGKYESLVQVTVIPKGKENNTSLTEANSSRKGVTEKLQQVLNKVKSPPAKSGGIYDDLYGDSFSSKVGSSWAFKSGSREASPGKNESNIRVSELEKPETHLSNDKDDNDDEDDLFG